MFSLRIEAESSTTVSVPVANADPAARGYFAILADEEAAKSPEMKKASPRLNLREVPFFSGNPNVEITRGALHLYHSEPHGHRAAAGGAAAGGGGAAGGGAHHPGGRAAAAAAGAGAATEELIELARLSEAHLKHRSMTLGILAVPSWMGVADLYRFVGACVL